MTVADIRDSRPTSQTTPSVTGKEPEPQIPEGEATPTPSPEPTPEPASPAPSPTPEPSVAPEPTEPVAPADPSPASPEPAAPAATDPAQPDYKKKFRESSRESQVLLGSFAEMKRVLGEVTSADIPTDEDLAREYPEFDVLSDFEKNQLRRTVATDRKMNKLLVIVDGVSQEGEKVKAISDFIETRPELKGKEDDFLRFCLMPSHKGAPAATLLSAYLYEEGQTAPKPDEPPAPPAPAPAPRGLERGSPSGDTPTSTGPREYSDEELRRLRKQDPKKYHELIRKGQI